MEKTIKEWLETLPEPIRTEALENAYNSAIGYLRHSLSSALSDAFWWADSIQGSDYWEDIYDRAEAGEFNNSSIDK